MEKRFILFVILTLVIFTLYPFLLEKLGYAPIPVQTTQSQEQQPESTPTPLPKIPDITIDPGAEFSPAEERVISVQTDLYKVILTTRGGTISEWRLDRYTEGTALDAKRIYIYQATTNVIPPLSILTGDEAFDASIRRGVYQG